VHGFLSKKTRLIFSPCFFLPVSFYSKNSAHGILILAYSGFFVIDFKAAFRNCTLLTPHCNTVFLQKHSAHGLVGRYYCALSLPVRYFLVSARGVGRECFLGVVEAGTRGWLVDIEKGRLVRPWLLFGVLIYF